MTPTRWSRLRDLLDNIVHGAERHRAYFYRVVGLVLPVLVASGSLTDGLASKILFIAGAVLGLPAAGLAAANTSTGE